jgi:hypothetical protein
VRRGTLIAIIVLLVALAVAAAFQISLANRREGPFVGPTSPGQLPSPSSTS